MAKKRRVSKKQIEAFMELLDRILDELPSGSVELSVEEDAVVEDASVDDAASEDSVVEQEDEDEYSDDVNAADVEVATIEVIVDSTLSEMAKNGIIRVEADAYPTLSGAFESIFGEESEFAELALDLETLLSGYNDFINPADVELAIATIEELKEKIDALIGAK